MLHATMNESQRVLDVIVVGILLEKRGAQYFTVIFERKPKFTGHSSKFLEVTTRAVARKAASGGGGGPWPDTTTLHCQTVICEKVR